MNRQAQQNPSDRALKADEASGSRFNWERVHVWFSRMLAIGWMTTGLHAWAIIIGFDVINGRPFEARALTVQAVTIYFSVVDILSAVGLWLLAPWGGVVWLIAAVSRVVLAFVFPAAAPMSLVASGLVASCIVLFMGLSWLTARRQTR